VTGLAVRFFSTGAEPRAGAADWWLAVPSAGAAFVTREVSLDRGLAAEPEYPP